MQCQDLMYDHKVRAGSTATLENRNQTGGFALTASHCHVVLQLLLRGCLLRQLCCAVMVIHYFHIIITGKCLSNKECGGCNHMRRVHIQLKIKGKPMYECGQTPLSFAWQCNFSYFNCKNMLRKCKNVKDNVKSWAPLKSTILMTKDTGPLEMGK